MKKVSSIIILLLLNLGLALPAAAQDIDLPTRTILPETRITSNFQCNVIVDQFEEIYFFEEAITAEVGSIQRFTKSLTQLNETATGVDFKLKANDILGCTIITGKIRLAYLNLFIFYIIRWLTIISGIASMFFIVIGGYKYIMGALSENKEEGKKTIIYALAGLVISTLAWIIVNIVQTFVTG